MIRITHITFLVVILLMTGQIFADESSNVCEQCTCGSDNNYFTLDCTHRGMMDVITNWPEDFEIENKDSIIIASFSGNALMFLNKLPPLESYLIFSCRDCKLLEVSSGVFLNTPKILRLDLSHNLLTAESLTADIFRGRFSEDEYEPILLEELDLSYNTIHALERRLFEHIPSLKTLSLAHNLITHIDSVFAESLSMLTKLEHLDLSHTGIKILPDQVLVNKPLLRELLLYGNEYEEVPESIKLVSDSLKSLYIGDNPIKTLTSSSFEGLTHVVHLNISFLKEITSIDNFTFEKLESMEVLSIKHSQLRAFNLTQLQFLSHLRELDISNCNLTTLIYIHNEDEEVFPKLRSLKLGNNNWYCDCSLHLSLQILEHHGSRRFQSDDDARCRDPNNLSGLLLTDFFNGPYCKKDKVQRIPRIPIYEPPKFLRPKSILISLAAVLTVIAIGLVIGFVIVQIKKQWKKNDLGFVTPVRYSTVRNESVSSVTTTTVTS